MKGPIEGKRLIWEIWVKPGKEQTLEGLMEKFAGRILRVNDNGEILIQSTELTS